MFRPQRAFSWPKIDQNVRKNAQNSRCARSTSIPLAYFALNVRTFGIFQLFCAILRPFQEKLSGSLEGSISGFFSGPEFATGLPGGHHPLETGLNLFPLLPCGLLHFGAVCALPPAAAFYRRLPRSSSPNREAPKGESAVSCPWGSGICVATGLAGAINVHGLLLKPAGATEQRALST